MKKIVFLMYHAIFDDDNDIKDLDPGDRIYWVRLSDFIDQMLYIKKSQFKTISLKDYIEEKKKINDKTVVITFDDGHVSNYTMAYPVLKKLGFSAEFFVTTGWADIDDYMSWNKLKELDQAGFSIQAHTETHPLLSDLDYKRLYSELSLSKTKIEDKINKKCEFFAPPGGRYNKRIKEIARRCGYKAVCTSIVGYNKVETDAMMLKRVPIFSYTREKDFIRIVHCDKWYYLKEKIRYHFYHFPKILLGNRNYNKLRSMIFQKKKI